MKILVTGASGFVGSSLIPVLLERGHEVVAQVRSLNKTAVRLEHNNDQGDSENVRLRNLETSDPGLLFFETGEINTRTDWSDALKHTDAVIHLAQRAHVLKEKEENPLEVFREVNVYSLENLLDQAIQYNIKHFIFISSIGVNGRKTNKIPFSETDEPRPEEDYAISKLEAEELIQSKLQGTEAGYTIIRPPLIIGPNPVGNIKVLIAAVKKRIPLPFAGIHNKRSFVGISNLCDFILFSLNEAKTRDSLFLVSDAEEISTRELISKISFFLNKKDMQFYFPVSLLKAALKILGRKKMIDSLLSSLQINPSKACSLGWKAPYSIDYEIKRAVDSI